MKHQGIKPIIRRISLETTPGEVYRCLISQSELRQWWAPRVITARNLISYKDGREIEMRQLVSEKNSLVRFKWRPRDWHKKIPSTILTFEIEDLGVSRNTTGEGIFLTITHDGWIDSKERNKQEKIIKKALNGLKTKLEKGTIKLWWEAEKKGSGFREIKLSDLKQFTEKIEKEASGNRNSRIMTAQNIMKIYEMLRGSGNWFRKEDEDEFEFRYKDQNLFSIRAGGFLTIDWMYLETKLGSKAMRMFYDRIILEQGFEVKKNKFLEKIQCDMIHADLLIQWVKDIIRSIRNLKYD